MTIYDIAREAEVSASTVSRVLNNEPRIRDSTRQKVLDIIKKHDFHPNAAARGLVNQSSMIIGILLTDIRMLHHSEGAYIIENELAQLGYCCIILNAGATDAAREESMKVLVSRRAEGVVMMGSAFQTEGVRRCIAKYMPELPVVLANGYLDLPNVYSVLADERSGLEGCVKLLAKKGKTHLSFINDPSTASNLQKQRGFELGIERCCLGEPLIVESRSGDVRMDGYLRTRELMAAHPETDGIIYHTDLAAAGGVRALQELGLEIPGRVAVIGVDNSIHAEVCYPQITSLDNKLSEMSITCASTLIQALQGKTAAHKMLIFSDIVERETT